MAYVTTGLKNHGLTTHYKIEYHTSLSVTDGKHQANALIAVCETDFKLMSDWFNRISPTDGTRITVQIGKTLTNGGNWEGEWKWDGPTVTLATSSGATVDLLRYALVAEVVEIFMRAQRKGWYGTTNEGSAGEGLSHFLGNKFLNANRLDAFDPAAFPANEWMKSAREDYVNNIDPDDYSAGPKSGCAILFIYYLNEQLGFSIEEIIHAAAPSLAEVYRNLTGKADNPFPHFKYLLDNAYPGTSIIPDRVRFGPFPLGQLVA